MRHNLSGILSSPLRAEVAKLVEKRLGRPLEPFDIWYNGFRPRGTYTEAQLDEARRFAKAGDASPAGLLGRYPKMRAALVLARAASPSPAAIDASVVGACREGGLSAPAIIELVTWISVLQMLHRLSSYFVE